MSKFGQDMVASKQTAIDLRETAQPKIFRLYFLHSNTTTDAEGVKSK